MFKKISFSLLFACIAYIATAQIQFFEGNYKNALKTAKQENKNIFIDFYATWCRPCKVMSQTVFTTKEVGDYFNSKFICCKIDAELPANAELVKRFKITSYPTMVFIDSKDRELKKVDGTVTPEMLIRYAKIAISERKDIPELYELYKKDKKNFDIQQQILIDAPIFINTQQEYERDKWVARIDQLFSNYVKNKVLDNMVTIDDFKIMTLYISNDKTSEDIFNFIVKNYDQYCKVVGKDDVNQFITSFYNSKIVHLCKKGNADYKKLLSALDGDLKAPYSSAKFGDVPLKEAITLLADATYSLYRQNADGFISNTNKYFALMGKNISVNDYTQPLEDLFSIYNGVLPEQVNAPAIEWINKTLTFELEPQLRCRLLIMMGQCYINIRNKDMATKCLNQAYVMTSQIVSEPFRAKLQEMIGAMNQTL